MQLDLVPLDEKVLGFANRWYKLGFEAAISRIVVSGIGALVDFQKSRYLRITP